MSSRYSRGYADGEEEGYQAGMQAARSEGYQAGMQAARSEGYQRGYQARVAETRSEAAARSGAEARSEAAARSEGYQAGMTAARSVATARSADTIVAPSNTSWLTARNLFSAAMVISTIATTAWYLYDRYKKSSNKNSTVKTTETKDAGINAASLAETKDVAVNTESLAEPLSESSALPQDNHGGVFTTQGSFDLLSSAAGSRAPSPRDPKTPPNSEADIMQETLKIQEALKEENRHRLFQQAATVAPAAQSAPAEKPKENAGWFSYLPWSLG